MSAERGATLLAIARGAIAAALGEAGPSHEPAAWLAGGAGRELRDAHAARRAARLRREPARRTRAPRGRRAQCPGGGLPRPALRAALAQRVSGDRGRGVAAVAARADRVRKRVACARPSCAPVWTACCSSTADSAAPSCPRSGSSCRNPSAFLAHLKQKAGPAARLLGRGAEALALHRPQVARIRREARHPLGEHELEPTSRALVAPSRRRTRPVRPVSARLRAARRPARRLLRAPESRRRDGAHHLRPLVRLLHRPDREEAAEPLLPRLERALVRHRRLQPGLQVLPELGHQQVEGHGPADGPGEPGRHRARRRGRRLQERRLHLQRSGDLRRVRPRHGGRLPRARHPDRGRHRGLHPPRSRGASSTPRSTPPTSTSRPSPILLLQARQRAPRARARYAPLHPARDEHLAGDHDPADPRQERLGRGADGDVRVDRPRARPGRAAALQRLPSRLQADRRSGHAARAR